MRTLLVVILLTSISGCAKRTVARGELITSANADLITSYDTTDIESMVTYYFASRVRGDQKWMEVLPDSSVWSDRMRHAISRHNLLKFVEFKNIGFHKGEYGDYVKIYMKVEYGGHSVEGEDEVELVKRNGHYMISKVPI